MIKKTDETFKKSSRKPLSTAVSLDVFDWIDPQSSISVFEKSKTVFFNRTKTIKCFREFSQMMYLPFLKFILNQEIKTFLIITGRFLEMAIEYEPKIILILKKLENKKLIEIVTNEYHGASLSCLYNSEWWSEGILKTYNLIEKELGIKTNYTFLPQLFRGLELEKIIRKTGQTKFLLSRQSKKYFEFESILSDFRRFNGKHVNWIDPKENQKCQFKFIYQKSLFEVNGNIFQKDQAQGIKTFSLAVGYFASEFEIVQSSRKFRTEREMIRFSEKPNKSNFSNLEKAVIRLLDYGLNLIQSYPNIFAENPKNQEVLKDFEAVHSSEFLFFLTKKLYLEKNPLLFNSPYEAFITVQAIITKLELTVESNQK
jgi:hypothetical protein